MEDFRNKARLVARGHKTKASASITYVNVVSKDTVRTSLMIATLNDLEVKLGNILNAYVYACGLFHVDYFMFILLGGGHMIKAPVTITYATVVSRKTVRIMFLFVALNDLEVKLGDILNAYIKALVTGKAWTTLSSESGKDTGMTEGIVKAVA